MLHPGLIWMLIFPLVLAAILYVLLTTSLWPIGVVLWIHTCYIMSRPPGWRRSR